MTANEVTLPTNYQSFIHMSRYSRWLDNEQRRETWEETVDRFLMFIKEHLIENYSYTITNKLYDELRSSMLNLQVLGSMRALMTAGPALKRENIAGYNCSYLPIDSPRCFDEALYVPASITDE